MEGILLKLPFLTLIGGIILRIVDFITASILVKGTTVWTLEMGTTVFYIRLTITIILCIVIVVILHKIYDRKTLAKSATLLVVYSIAIFALEQVTQNFAAYNMIIHWLYLPVEIFTIITSILARVFVTESLHWTYVIPSLFAPYLFVLFGKNVKTELNSKIH
jgi:hypothetical protein